MKIKKYGLGVLVICALFAFCTPVEKNKVDSVKQEGAICNPSSIVEWAEEEVEIKKMEFGLAKNVTIEYYKDTIGARIKWDFDVLISNDKQADSPTDIVISLLEENGYDDFHRLIFTYRLIGLCSPVPHISIDINDEIGIIRVFNDENVLVWKFAEIRGRLSTRTDYIYDENMELIDSVHVAL